MHKTCMIKQKNMSKIYEKRKLAKSLGHKAKGLRFKTITACYRK